jgi:hypothetical protein
MLVELKYSKLCTIIANQNSYKLELHISNTFLSRYISRGDVQKSNACHAAIFLHSDCTITNCRFYVVYMV